VVSRVGDIIRIHRSTLKNYRGIKQFNANIFYNSSWCLFNTSDDLDDHKKENYIHDNSDDQDDEYDAEMKKKQKYVPYKFSGKSFTF
jgi:hypothetical protein